MNIIPSTETIVSKGTKTKKEGREQIKEILENLKILAETEPKDIESIGIFVYIREINKKENISGQACLTPFDLPRMIYSVSQYSKALEKTL